ncbi:MAG: hypothetical protein JWO13_454 [Acidobacteriales bacterium]|nr:hypothetical protein [Terriglobales bacterium]
MKKECYTVAPDFKVIGPEGIIGAFDNPTTAGEFAGFLNSDTALLQIVDSWLSKNDPPISGAEWARIQSEWRRNIR